MRKWLFIFYHNNWFRDLLRKKQIGKLYYKGSGDVGYLYLPNHPHSNGCVNKTLEMPKKMLGGTDATLYLNYAKNGELIGIEILYG